MSIKTIFDLTNPMHIYYDLSITNGDSTGLNPPIPLSFTEARNNPFLSSPEDYYMSVVRFQIQTGDALPVFIPAVQLGQTDPNLLIYSITLTYKNYEQQQYVYYISDDLTQPVPNPPLDFQDLTSNYYFISTYQSWISMVNETFKECFNNLNIKVLAGGDTLPSSNAPYMEWDVYNLVGILDCDISGYNKDLANPINIYMNSPMYNLFSSFPCTIQGYQGTTNGKNILINVFNNNNTNILNLPSYNALQVYQEDSTISLMNPIASIVFTTALLPVIPTNVGVPKIFGKTSNLTGTGNNANISNVISDFVVPLETSNRYKPNIVYTPQGEYRLFSMTGNSPVSAIEITAYWKDNYGGLHNIYLNSGNSASIKLMFRRKDYSNITL